ncbi:UNVERIFIED_CONTAM: hypothetical protein PYX00_009860 [Menopon gallinae]|uniref:Sphingomyelin phosphodiesterase n=1 Tax=Menopon gallinae TaxID=328185 RepID=A0AAW2HDA7_9NEOP
MSNNPELSQYFSQTIIISFPAVGLVKFLAQNNRTEEELLEIATGFCVDLNIMTPTLCKGLLKINGPSLLHIIRSTDMGPSQICGYLVKFDCGEEETETPQWKVDVPNVSENEVMSTVRSDDSVKPLKVLHISDTHFDPHYVEGVSDDCPLPLCCRADAGTEGKSVSGKWGGWKCDIPERTLDNLLEHIAAEHKDIDYVIWTGDIPPHDSWSLSKDEGLSILNQTVSKILRTFPNIPVYPALGNHEAVPPNLFPPSGVDERWSVDWLYRELEKEWSKWLPENSYSTIRRGAFYTVLNRPGLRIVSLNTNYCYYGNWWLILNSTDPEQELEWLVDILKEAEEKGEKVHIIGHIPPGHTDCLKTWQTNYYDIVERFSKTIAGQFFGHTHNDEFEIFYERKNPEKAVNVAYLAPSVTTYTYLNPGYRIYYIDGDYEGSSRTVLDHDTWFMDMEEANAKGTPTWAKLYSAKEDFNMTSLTPTDWHELYNRIRYDDDVFEQYDRYFWSDSPKRSKCNVHCKKEKLCVIRSCSQYGDIQA